MRQHLHVSQLHHSLVSCGVGRNQLLLHVPRALQRLRTQRQIVVDVGLERHLSLAQPLRQLRDMRVEPVSGTLQLLPAPRLARARALRGSAC